MSTKEYMHYNLVNGGVINMDINNTNTGKTKNGNIYTLQAHGHPSFQLCFTKGFDPIGDNLYIDQFIYESLGVNKPIPYIPELDDLCLGLVETTVDNLKNNFEEHGNLSGQLLQNMASWMVAWAFEIVWCWDNSQLENIEFTQDMNRFQVPLTLFEKLPEAWVEDLVKSFMVWCYENPGYTDRQQIDIYDPLRDGYLTILRAVMAKLLPLL